MTSDLHVTKHVSYAAWFAILALSRESLVFCLQRLQVSHSLLSVNLEGLKYECFGVDMLVSSSYHTKKKYAIVTKNCTTNLGAYGFELPNAVSMYDSMTGI